MTLLRRVYEAFFRDGIRSTLRWMVLYLALLGLAVAHGFHLLDQQRFRACEDRNQAQRNGAEVVVKALLKASGPDVEQARVDAFVADIDRGLAEVEVDC